MKLVKYLALVALLLVSFAVQLNAQTAQGIVAGSSALWVEAGQGMAVGNCAWTSTSGNNTNDSRVAASLQNESGNLWVVWTTGTGGTCAAPTADSNVYAYISLDSTVGNRCLFAQPQCTLQTSNAALTAGANKLPGVVDTPLPASILAAFNGQSVNIAATDILPADAKFATYSTLAACGPLSAGTQFVGLGYGPGPVGATINSFYSTKSFHVIDFNIFGNDPINTNLAIPAATVTPVGAAPELVVVNTLNSQGFGLPAVQNANRAVLALYFAGIFGRTADLLPQAFAGTGATYYGTTALLREPLSGTYRVFEHSIPNNKEIYRAMDSGNCGANGTFTVTTNPLNLTRTIGTTTSVRNRVIGTGEMVSKLQTVQDAIGYAFWSAGNFAGTSNIKYLTVDGVDPILDSYAGGAVPTSGNGLLPNVTLSHVKDGTYPIWSMLRLVSYAGGQAAAQTLAAAAQAQVSFGAGATQPDFVPFNQLNVFHAHFAPSGFNFNSGNVASDGPAVCGPNSNPEAGGDNGGLVFTLQAGADYCVLKGNYNAAGGVGPTNTASFGIRQ